MPKAQPRWPAHHSPTASDRTASAPYNFVPLPDMIVPAVDHIEDLPSLASYATPEYPCTGYFEVVLETLAPLYIRCGLPRERFDRRDTPEDVAADFRCQIKNSPEFFYTHDPATPVIPGSSLRGMLRALVEIVSYGKVQPVTDRRLFYRSVDNSTLGTAYRDRMVDSSRNRGGATKVEAGFLRFRGGTGEIQKVQHLRVAHSILDKALRKAGLSPWPSDLDASQVPDQSLQHRRIFIKIASAKAEVTELCFEPRPGYQEARLIITGWAPKKAHEFVFLLPQRGAEVIEVPSDLIERFEDNDQITQWQERAFPAGNDRPRAGGLRRAGGPGALGDPIFFLREGGQLSFFGRAGLFRLPYRHTPWDLIPEELRPETGIDYAEAMFGFVDKGQDTRARAGRVAVTDGTFVPGQTNPWLTDTPIVPPILGTPKPTAFQHYLVQEAEAKNQLLHYDSPPRSTVLRGHKLYWRQGPRERLDLVESEPAKATDTQHTQFRPLRAGVTFTFRVYFENLSDRELGVLCWALHPLGDPDRTYCHALGMGKPLGMGAVRLTATLHRTDRQRRYRSLFTDTDWETGVDPAGEPLADRAILQRWVAPFERHVLETLGRWPECESLHALDRIRALLALLEWPGLPPRAAPPRDGRPAGARALTLEEFKTRRVLPAPLPAHHPVTPAAATSPGGAATPASTGPRRPASPRSDGVPASPRPAPSGVAPEQSPFAVLRNSAVQPPPQSAPREVRRGDKLKATVIVQGKYRARVRLDPPYTDEFPVDLQPPQVARFQQGMRVTVKVSEIEKETKKIKSIKPE